VKSSISLVLIDDNRLVREGLAALIRQQPGFTVLASGDIDEALRKVREARPDVILLDFGLENHDSLRVAATIHKEVPEAKIVVMGLFALQEDIAAFVRAGAAGFLLKEASLDDLVRTIRAVVDGGSVLPEQLTTSLFGQIARHGVRDGRGPALAAVRLTPRERQVMELIGNGLSNKEIARRLQVALHTVKSHVHNVLEKLALHSRLEVAAFTHTVQEKEDPLE
jgi:DNA-binding NarL/FixJ family response regulator